MNNKRTIVVAEDKKEYCVVCWGETPYTKNTHIDYVGQICEKCRVDFPPLSRQIFPQFKRDIYSTF